MVTPGWEHSSEKSFLQLTSNTIKCLNSWCKGDTSTFGDGWDVCSRIFHFPIFTIVYCAENLIWGRCKSWAKHLSAQQTELLEGCSSVLFFGEVVLPYSLQASLPHFCADGEPNTSSRNSSQPHLSPLLPSLLQRALEMISKFHAILVKKK